MIRHNHKRGNELQDHIEAKSNGRQMLLDADFDMAICEYHNCDVIGKRRVGNHVYILAVEFERCACRHIVANCLRDLAYKCDRILIVCLPPLSVDKVERLLVRKLSVDDRSKVAVVLQKDLSVALLKSMNGSAGVSSGIFSLIREVNSEEAKDNSSSKQVNSVEQKEVL